MRRKIKALLTEVGLTLDHSLLGSMPPEKQIIVVNPTIASLVYATAEFLISFSLLFMLLNGVFTDYFLLSSSVFSVFVKVLLLALIVEGVYRMFLIILDKRQSAGSVFYTLLGILSKGVSKLFSFCQYMWSKMPKIKKKTAEEKKQKEIAENFKKFIEYGMDQPSLTYERQ